MPEILPKEKRHERMKRRSSFSFMVRPLTSGPGLRSVPSKKLEDLQWLVRGENLPVNGPIGPSKNLPDVPSGKQAVRAEHRVVFIEESVTNERPDNATAGYAKSCASGGNGEPIAQEVVQ